MKIYTKGGDSGFTDLFGGGRVLKNNLRVKAYGAIDAANSAIGMAASAPQISSFIKEELIYVMKLLFSAGAEVATATKASAQKLLDRELENRLNESHVLRLEHVIDSVEAKLSPLKSFILPYGSDAAARLHNARTAVRHAESVLVDLLESEKGVRPVILQFFNRLSDYLFVLARLANKECSCPDLLWNGKLKDEEPGHTAD
ncbi:MAG TPA: cob(I)yrinic acid a,c-diamide adenosyltransferase [Myxococcota bacterium]|nr:cob(I)yrinic acid a,c-diamide adenosyltransferase [Myxococcota bacterium]